MFFSQVYFPMITGFSQESSGNPYYSYKFHPHPVIFVEDNLSHDGIDAKISHSIRLFLLAYRLVIPNHGVMRHCFSLFFDKHILSN